MTTLALPARSFAESPESGGSGRIYVHATLIFTLVLQRFGLMVGGSALFISLPAFLVILLAMVATGHARLRTRGTLLYCLFASVALVSTLLALAMPDQRFGISLASLGAVLATYLLAVFGPTERFDRTAVATLYLAYMRVFSVLGIAQFCLQFAGLRFFSFLVSVPALRPILIESQYNYDPVMHYGSALRRSNGLLLIEPSVFSQLLVLAAALDFFIRGNMRWLPLYAAAYVVTFSGTGLLALVIALPIFACLSVRNFRKSALFIVGGIVAVLLLAVALPDQFASFSDRADELQYSGSSGYLRYIAPFAPLHDLLEEARVLIGWGPGATERYLYHVEGTGNSIAKLVMDYGVIGLITFLAMLVGTLWRKDMALLSLIALANFILGGGYLVFAPILVLSFLLCIWSEPVRSA